MARNCPKDQVRALVEGTLDMQGSAAQEVASHLYECASCRKLKERLEAKEKSFRAALGAYGVDDSSRCPSAAELATVCDQGLEASDQGLVDHIARCGQCRLSLSSTVAAAQAPAARTPDETIAAARRRVAIARTKSDAAKSDAPAKTPSARVPSGRRRTARQSAANQALLLDGNSSRWGLALAAAACFLVAFAFFAFVRDGATPNEEPTSQKTPPQAPKPISQPQTPAPQQPAPPKAPAPDEVVAQAPQAPLPPVEPPVEEEPREPEQQPAVAPQQPSEQPAKTPEQPAKSPEQPAQPTPAPVAPPTTPHTAPTTPVTPRPADTQPTVLACKVDAVSGPIEIRKKAEKSWHKLSVAELVQDGDGLRSKGEDGSITFASKARVNFDAECTGTVGIKSTGICVLIESGGLEGEALAYDGLEIREANGTVTVWKGGKVRLETSERGLRVCVDKGTANAGNDLGKVTVHSGQEVLLQKDRKPTRPVSTSGPYRTPRR